MKFHIKALFNAVVNAATPIEAKEKFIDKAYSESPFHLQEKSIDIEPISGGDKKKSKKK